MSKSVKKSRKSIPTELIYAINGVTFQVPDGIVTNDSELIKKFEDAKDLGKEVKKVLKEVEKDLDETEKTKSFLQILDLSLPYNHMFTAASKKALNHKVKGLVNVRKAWIPSLRETVEVIDKVEYLGTIVSGEEKLVKAGRMVADLINRLSALGYVTGCLAPLSCIRMEVESYKLDTYGIFCYVSLTKEGSDLLDAENCPLRFRADEGLFHNFSDET